MGVRESVSLKGGKEKAPPREGRGGVEGKRREGLSASAEVAALGTLGVVLLATGASALGVAGVGLSVAVALSLTP